MEPPFSTRGLKVGRGKTRGWVGLMPAFVKGGGSISGGGESGGVGGSVEVLGGGLEIEGG